jgi:type II secretory pathway pseudopilin PulG
MPRTQTAGRRGLTLFQLLVVLAVLALLLGLLLPAIQRARGSAKRRQDENNIKQICLGTINCADINQGKLPPLAGPYPSPDPATPFNGHGTLFFHILPYIEQQNLYKSALTDKAYRSDAPGLRSTVIKPYVSESDPDGGKDLVHDGWLAKSNFPANFQVFGNPAKNTLAGESRYPASITDGTSNTLFFTQRYQLCNGDPCGWAYDAGTTWAPAFAYLSQGKFQTRPGGELCDSTLAQGLEADGILVGLGDGSVRLVADTVSPQTWWIACTPTGGEVFGPDW